MSARPSVRLSTCISVATAQQIFVKFVIGDLTKICPETPVLLIIGQRSRVLFTWRSKYFCIVGNSTKCFVARQQCKWKHLLYFYVSALYFWQLHVGQQQYKWNALLRFDGNNNYTNAPQCSIIRTLLTLYGMGKFITFFARVRSLHLSWARVIQSTFSHPNSLRSILTFRHHASSIWDRRFTALQRTHFVYLLTNIFHYLIFAWPCIIDINNIYKVVHIWPGLICV